MKLRCFILAVLAIFASSCSKKEGHPWVEPGMSRTEVVNIMGQPIRTDSIYHQHDLDRGSIAWEKLDSIRRTLPVEEGNRMTLGRFVDHSAPSDQYVSWYYGPVVVDTSFTFERSAAQPDSLVKTWYLIKKQRAVVFDAKSMVVKERGFSIMSVSQL
jgi:hypothetical protein